MKGDEEKGGMIEERNAQFRERPGRTEICRRKEHRNEMKKK